MRRPLLFILAAGTLGVAACDNERAIGNEPVGDPAYGIRFVVAGANVPQGIINYRGSSTRTVGTTDTVVMTLRGLDSLAGNARYTLWIGDSARNTFQRFPARVTLTRADTVTNAQGDPVEQISTTTFASTSSFSNGGPRVSFNIRGGVPAGFAAGTRPGVVLVTIEESPNATVPSPNRRPFFATRRTFTPRDTLLRIDVDTVRFGFYHVRPESLYIYRVGPQRGRATFRGNVLVVNDSSLPQPPRGYFYATYLLKRDDRNQPVDTIYLGPQTAPAPRRNLSLRDADSIVVDPLVQVGTTVQTRQILAAAARRSADTTTGLDVNIPFRDVADVLVTLELKNYKVDEARLGPAIILRADVPTIIRTGPRPQ